MKPPFLILLAGLALLAAPLRSLAAPPAVDRSVQRGRELAEILRHAQPAGPNASNGTLRIRGADGRRTTVPIEVQVSMEAGAWTTIYRARFPDGRREILTVRHLTSENPQIVLQRATRDGKMSEVSPSTDTEIFTSFAGTDFWLVDLGLAFLHWPDQRWTGREVRRTRVCDVLESRNPAPAPGTYSKVRTWVDEETGGIVRAEAYDTKNKLLKEFSPGSFARVGSHYELRDMEIRNEQTDSRTTLIFESADPDQLGVKHLPRK